MQTKNTTNESKKFLSVLSDGKFHQTVSEGTNGAVVRNYEDKEGNKKTKHELIFDSVSGMITKISFEDGDYGKNLNIELDGDGVISLNTSSSFGEDVMKKLPNIDLNKEVEFKPFSFKDDKDKLIKGVTLIQDDKKLTNYYYDIETKKVINNMPEFEGKKTDNDDWKIYFMQVRKFLIQEINNKFISGFNGL